MCHGTWNYLSEVELLRPLLYSWRDDNLWMHSIGGWAMGIWIVFHVWALMLPSIFQGFENVSMGGKVVPPVQVGIGLG